jgi:hypothetical protein
VAPRSPRLPLSCAGEGLASGSSNGRKGDRRAGSAPFAASTSRDGRRQVKELRTQRPDCKRNREASLALIAEELRCDFGLLSQPPTAVTTSGAGVLSRLARTTESTTAFNRRQTSGLRPRRNGLVVYMVNYNWLRMFFVLRGRASAVEGTDAFRATPAERCMPNSRRRD